VFSKYTHYYFTKREEYSKISFSVLMDFRELKKVWKMFQTEVPQNDTWLSFFVFSMAVSSNCNKYGNLFWRTQEISWKDADESQIVL
jgi:hypothetical protein